MFLCARAISTMEARASPEVSDEYTNERRLSGSKKAGTDLPGMDENPLMLLTQLIEDRGCT
jgi:hypothetical protein